MFIDANSDTRSTGDSGYGGDVTIRVVNNGTGSGYAVTRSIPVYVASNLPAGQYTVTFSEPLAAGYRFTYPPPNPVNRSLIVTVGPSCSPSGPEAVCNIGNVYNLNAGVTNFLQAWLQSIGSDMRWDSGFNNPLPSGKYASIPAADGMPGIIFSGASTPNFGSGQASQTYNWKVGNSANPEVFTQTHSLIPTSYRFLLETAQGSGITPAAIASVDSSLAHGIYKTDGNITINTPVTFGSGNFIILINGNLTINSRIIVPVGSTAIFSAKGNITVNRTVGEGAASAAPTIEGLYSADNNFIADGANNCPTVDLRLNVAGSVIANAGRTGGTFANNRTLCIDNSSYPSVSFIERPDFILNYPSMVSQTARAWQDVAP